MKTRTSLILLAVAVLALVAVQPARAATYTWQGLQTGAAATAWNGGNNWVGGVYPQNPGPNDLIFTTSLHLANHTSSLVCLKVGTMTFDSNAGAFDITDGGGYNLTLSGDIINDSTSLQTIRLGLALAAGAHTINASAGDITINQGAAGGVINGAGQTFITTVISLISLWIVRVPLALYLAHRLGTVTGVWYAIAASFAVSMLSSLMYYSTGRWRRSVIRHGPAAVTETALFGEQTGEA